MDELSQQPKMTTREATKLLRSVMPLVEKQIRDAQNFLHQKEEVAQLMGVMDQLQQAGFNESDIEKIRRNVKLGIDDWFALMGWHMAYHKKLPSQRLFNKEQ
jgi:predicted house-cleaning noncanonical NTP pyrophosphatase (MazG superfamily)